MRAIRALEYGRESRIVRVLCRVQQLSYYSCQLIHIYDDADVKTCRIREFYPVFSNKDQILLTRIGPSQKISLPQPKNPQHNKAPFFALCPIMVHVSVSVSDGLDRCQSHLFLALSIPISRVAISKARRQGLHRCHMRHLTCQTAVTGTAYLHHIPLGSYAYCAQIACHAQPVLLSYKLSVRFSVP